MSTPWALHRVHKPRVGRHEGSSTAGLITFLGSHKWNYFTAKCLKQLVQGHGLNIGETCVVSFSLHLSLCVRLSQCFEFRLTFLPLSLWCSVKTMSEASKGALCTVNRSHIITLTRTREYWNQFLRSKDADFTANVQSHSTAGTDCKKKKRGTNKLGLQLSNWSHVECLQHMCKCDYALRL